MGRINAGYVWTRLRFIALRLKAHAEKAVKLNGEEGFGPRTADAKQMEGLFAQCREEVQKAEKALKVLKETIERGGEV